MSIANNILIADFTAGGRWRETTRIWQHDYGRVLQINGLDLPDEFEVHFANVGKKDDAIPVYGSGGQVEIPNQLIKTGRNILAWLFLHSGESDGETMVEVEIPVRPRVPPGDVSPEPHQQTIIDQLIERMETAVADAQAAAEEAGEAATEAAILARATATDDGDGNVVITYPSAEEETGG